MIEAIRWARENNLPFFGICLGLQVAIIEFARNVCELPDPNSTEFEPECGTPVINLMQTQRDVSDLGGTMRLGAYAARLRPGSKVAEAYGSTEISERHRHRWEVNNSYRDVLAEYGLRLSGQSPDGGLVETDRAPRSPLVHRLPVPSRTEVAPDPPASALRRLRRRGAAASPGAPRTRAEGPGPRGRALVTWTFGRAPFLIAGPCMVEDDDLMLRVGEALAALSARHALPVCFKASFDKANRSRRGGQRGPGLQEGLRALERVRAATGLPILTDIHEAAHAAPAAEVVDVLQIPAFLCRQTDLLVAAGRTGRPVNIKKGQWMQPEGMLGAVEKVQGAGAGEVAVTERGTFFGYGDLVVDMRSFRRMARPPGCRSSSTPPTRCSSRGRATGARAAASGTSFRRCLRRRRSAAPTASSSRRTLTRPTRRATQPPSGRWTNSMR